MHGNPRLATFPIASTFGELPSPTRPLAPLRPAAHIPLPIPFPDQAEEDKARHERLAGERALDREIERDREVPAHRQQADDRLQIALRAASKDAHSRGFNTGFWHGAKCGGLLGLAIGNGLGWVLCVLVFKAIRLL